jgi:hypothetical protein
VVLLDGKPQPGVTAAWIIDGEELAEAFRAYVTAEVDPAVKVRVFDPVGELLHWRAEVALPAAGRTIDVWRTGKVLMDGIIHAAGCDSADCQGGCDG